MTKLAEPVERLRQEVDYLRFALDATGQGVWEYDGITNVWSFSAAWKRMRGIPDDETYSSEDDSWFDRIHPDDRAHVRDAMARQYAGEIYEVAFEYRELHRAGHWIWILARGRCVSGYQDGNPLRIIGTDTDVTALRMSQQTVDRLARDEQRLREAVNSLSQGIWDKDYESGREFYSPSWFEMRGLSPNEPVPRPEEWLKNIHPKDRETLEDFFTKRADGRIKDVLLEYRERHRDGHWMWILAQGRAVSFDADGRPNRFVGMDADITQIKAREHEHAIMAQRLELALSTSSIGVWETDLNTGHAQWDIKTAELFGIQATGEISVLPGTWESYVHPSDREWAIATAKRGIARQKSYGFDYRVLLPDGKIKHVRCRAAIIKDLDGHDKLIGVNWDITGDIERAEAIGKAHQLAEQRSRELEQARQTLEHSALHDALTGLPNRRYVDKVMEDFGDGADRGKKMTLLNIDIDRFKQINDTRGHAAGDALLVHMAGVLKTCVRDSDMVARMGGDEFVIIMSPPPSAQGVQSIVNRIIEAAAEPMMWEGSECRSGVSIGIAEAVPGINARQLLINSDIALYRSKRAGRNRAAFFTEALQSEIIVNKQCADDILKGLDRNEFIPYFQPQIDAQSLEIVGMEALVRWRHPERGVLTPDKFLSVADELNALSTIDKIILEKSVAHLRNWEADGVVIPRIAVNVSARRLSDSVLLDSLSSLNVAPSRVSFELLESIFLDQKNGALVDTVRHLKMMGFRIELDDFGTGHASIVSLLHINPHRIKIARELVAPVVESEQQRRLVRSIVEIGKSQGISVCAEGVETARHVDILAELGCDTFQGYYFAKPMPAAEVSRFVLGRSWIPKYYEETAIGGVDGAVLREFIHKHGFDFRHLGTGSKTTKTV